jgi:hypothetical protein
MKSLKEKKSVASIKFVSPDEKEKVLEDCGFVITSQTQCFVCGRNINLDNIGAIKCAKDGKHLVVCNSTQCLINSKIIFNLI